MPSSKTNPPLKSSSRPVDTTALPMAEHVEMYDAKVMVLSKYVDHHVKEEHYEMFANVKVSSIDLLDFGERLAARKEDRHVQLASCASGFHSGGSVNQGWQYGWVAHSVPSDRRPPPPQARSGVDG